MAKFATSGRVTTASTEFTAVSVMLSATSPRNTWLNRFAVVPPGEAASSIMPTASSGGRSNRSTKPKQTTGSSTSWHTSAIRTAAGCLRTRTKSATVSDRPKPNITTASAMGNNTEPSTEVIVDSHFYRADTGPDPRNHSLVGS